MNAPGIPARWRIGDVIDDRYEITDVHEDGGMGLVYRVRHRSWATESGPTELAVKSPRPDVFAADRDSFVAEAEAWVSLGLHPNVCGCHYVRLFGGVPLVFAEYVTGGSLRKWIEDGRLYRGDAPTVAARVLDLAIQTARGLEHAHERGLVHQDVKPANVLLDTDGTAKVTDFGLAKARAVGGSHRRPGAPPEASVLVSAGGLTPAYASPEQAMGRPLSRRTDVYSFAVSVLEMYTGGLTWMSGLAAGHVLAALRTDGPGRPGPPPLPAGLAELLERCLRHDPAERPATMAEIAGAIAAVYRDTTGHDHPRPVPVAAELRADELNNRALSLMDLGRPADAEAAFAEALAADPRHLQASYNSGLLRWRRGAATDLDLITDLTGLLPQDGTAWELRHLLAQVHMERGDLDSAGDLLAEAILERPGEPDLLAADRTLRSGRLSDARAVETRRIPWYVWDDTPREFDGRPIRRAAPGIDIPLSADGRWALSSCDKVVRRWDLSTGEGEAPMPEITGDVDLDASGRFALSGDDGELRLWDLAERRLLGGAAVPGDWPEKWLMKVRLSADARTAVASVGRGRVVVWDTATGEPRHLFDGHFTQAPLELSDDGRLVLSPNNDDQKIRLFETASGRCLLEIPKKPSGVMGLRIRADNRVAAIATYDHVIDLWDLDGGRVIRSLTGPSDGYTSRIALSADGRIAVTGGIDHFGAAADGPDRNSVRIWDLRTGRVLRTFASAHLGGVRGVRLDGERAVSVGKDGMSRWSLPRHHSAAWQVSRPRRHGQIDEAAREVAELVARAEETLYAGDRRAALALLTRARAVPGHERSPVVLSAWHALGRSMAKVGLRGSWPVRTLEGHGAQVFSVAVSADGRTAVSGGIDREVRIWDLDTGACRHVTPPQPSPVDNVAVSADGGLALSASRDGVIAVWSTTTGERLREVDGGRTLGASPAAFSADGRLVLIATATASVQLWDLSAGPAGECVRMVETGIPGRGATAVRMDASGSLGAVAGGDDTVRLWNLGDGSPRTVLKGHSGPVRPLCLSAGGERVLTVAGGTMRLWDGLTGECLRIFEETSADAVCFSPDGRFVLSGGRDRAIRVWSVDNGRCVGVMEGHQAAVSALAMTRDGRFVLSGGDDKTVRIWELDWVLAPEAGDA
ncbi:WD40 repeat domain-containing serine/threonine protein kinase [Phytomonospora endophytica]|uniref:WD40 repeat protein n=1 Tax=Phytomonospora endophytica TaxID=714109 RepID=A0A841FJS4_9ACTN|nr:protein kinase [Phytomonospora endophytica]MBB6032230.1 WD40 repeat protein [Phytomonospora endophytica]GIG68579.1 hypothetical protein Pen01_48740 [Phytomonospora endophytica]